MPLSMPWGKKFCRLGDQRRDVRDWVGAEAFYRRHLKNHPRDAAIWVQLGHALKEQRRVAESEEPYRKGAELKPDDPDAFVHLGHVQKMLNKPEAAMITFQKALALAPDPELMDELQKLRAAGISVSISVPSHDTPSRRNLRRPFWKAFIKQPVHQENEELAAALSRIGMLENLSQALDAKVNGLRDGWNQHLPPLLEALSTANAQGGVIDNLNRKHLALRDNIEKLSSRFDAGIFETRDRLEERHRKAEPTVEMPHPIARIVSFGRIGQALEQKLLLHYCKKAPLDGKINISDVAGQGIDIIATTDTPLPFGPGVVAAITVHHGLGSCSMHDFKQRVLPQWIELLTEEGALEIRGLDLMVALDRLKSGSLSREALLILLSSDEKMPLLGGLTEMFLRTAIGDAGFDLEAGSGEGFADYPAGGFIINARKKVL